tara:strand:+ start:129 stop:833 length:705 start_codon:yes stop_codon:yes gene_type:complete
MVLNFYSSMPFNMGHDKNYENIPWPSLNEQLENAKTVTELGCGTGWLCNRIKNNFPNLKVTGIDISQTCIDSARYRGNDIDWQVKDLTKYKQKADVVVSIGVLHHIENANLQKLIEHTIKLSNKYAFIGLYHSSSRQAMFDFFARYPKKKHEKLFKKMMPHMTNDTQRESWFRDQFNHPYEVASSLKMFNDAATNTKYKLTYSNVNTDDMYDSTMNRLETFEFVSGFIYGGFEK